MCERELQKENKKYETPVKPKSQHNTISGKDMAGTRSGTRGRSKSKRQGSTTPNKKKTRTKSSSAKSQRSKSRSKSSAKSGFRARPRSDSTVEQLPSTLSWRTPLFAFTTDQINHEKLKVAVREYKYVSPKKTFLERLYLNKFWDFLAQLYPRWLAPNTITLVGYICFGIPVIVSFAFGYTQGDGACPNWWILLTLICQSIYQHADGSDGPQARRLKCGSALGELVDHGADAIVTGLFPYAMAELTGLGVDSPYFMLMLLGGFAAYFTSNMTLLHQEKQLFQDVDAQEAQQAGQLFLLVLYCYNVYNGIDGRGLYQKTIIPFPSFVPVAQQKSIVDTLIKGHEYLGLPTDCSTTSRNPCFSAGENDGSMGVSIAWFLVAGSCISIWSNVAKLVFTMLWYYARHGLPVNEDGKKVVFVGRGVQNLWSQLIACKCFLALTSRR